MKGNRTCIGGECSENSGPKKGPQPFLIPRMPVTLNLVHGNTSYQHHWEKLIKNQIYLHWEFPVSVFLLLFQLMRWEAMSHSTMVPDEEVHRLQSSTWKDLWECILLFRLTRPINNACSDSGHKFELFSITQAQSEQQEKFQQRRKKKSPRIMGWIYLYIMGWIFLWLGR